MLTIKLLVLNCTSPKYNRRVSGRVSTRCELLNGLKLEWSVEQSTMWVRWFLKSTHTFCVSRYAMCIFLKSPLTHMRHGLFKGRFLVNHWIAHWINREIRNGWKKLALLPKVITSARVYHCLLLSYDPRFIQEKICIVILYTHRLKFHCSFYVELLYT